MNASGISGMVLCGLLLCATAQAAEEPATDLPAAAEIERMPPGALPAPDETALVGEAGPSRPEGGATDAEEVPVEDRSGDNDKPLSDPPGVVPAPDAGTHI